MAKSTNEDVILQVKNMMTLTGLWPYKNESHFYKIMRYVGLISPFIFNIFIIDKLLKNLNRIEIVTDSLCLIATYFSFIIKLIIFIIKRETYYKLLTQLDNGKFGDYPTRFESYIKRMIKISNYIARMYQISCFTVIFLYLSKPLIITDGQRLPIEIAIDLGNFYYVFFIFEVFTMLLTVWNNSCLDALAMGLMNVASAQLDILRDKLITLNDFTEKNYDENDISDCIKDYVIHHMEIIRYFCKRKLQFFNHNFNYA